MSKLVIDIDERFYKYVCDEVESEEIVYKAIQNGTPLQEYCETCCPHYPTETEED